MNTCSDILKDFESGPLDVYRKRATINWKKMRVFIESEDILRYKVIINVIIKSLYIYIIFYYNVIISDESLENI